MCATKYPARDEARIWGGMLMELHILDPFGDYET
jgi:hypothetical protein